LDHSDNNVSYAADRLGTEPVGKLLLRFSIPAITGMIVNALYNVVDRLFVGQGVGEIALGGLSLVMPLMTITMAFSMLFGIGAANMISMRLGQQRRGDAESALNHCFWLLLGTGLLLMALGLTFLEPLLLLTGAQEGSGALPYAKGYYRIILYGQVFSMVSFGMSHCTRAQGFPTVTMTSMLIGACMNIALDPLFIFVFGWGVEGAAWATIISQLASAIWILSFSFSKKASVRLRLGPRKLPPQHSDAISAEPARQPSDELSQQPSAEPSAEPARQLDVSSSEPSPQLATELAQQPLAKTSPESPPVPPAPSAPHAPGAPASPAGRTPLRGFALPPGIARSLGFVRQIMSFGMAQFLLQIAASGVQIVYNNSMKWYGASALGVDNGGDIALSGLNIVGSMSMMILMPVFGINQGAQPILGYNYGAKKYGRALSAYSRAVTAAILVCTAGFVLTEAAPVAIVRLFTPSGSAALLYFAPLAMRIANIMLPLNGFSIVSSNMFVVTGRPRMSILLSMLRQVILLIPCMLLFGRVWGLVGVVAATPVADGLSALVTGAVIIFELKNMRRLAKSEIAAPGAP
jgi:Na+-driven multidrug efflux pump